MRTFVDRFLIHLVLSGVLVGAPTLRVLCYSSCVLEAGPKAEAMAGSDATPECHEHDGRHHSTPDSDSSPLQGECTHGGESSSFGLFASAKLVAGDGSRVSVISTVAVIHLSALSVASSDVRRDPPTIPSGGQLLGRFLTPLRI